MKKLNKAAFRGPHKVCSRTVPSGFAYSKMIAPSKYASFEYNPQFNDVIVRHYNFFQRLWYFIKQLFK